MPGYWNTDDQGGGQAPPSYPVSQPSGGHPGGWVSEPSQTFSTPPQVTTPIVDVAAEKDAIDDALAMANIAPDVYTPPSEIYGPGQATPGETGYASQNISPGMVTALGLDQIDPPKWETFPNGEPNYSKPLNVAAFFGYDPGSTTVPNELYQQYIQGSIVSGNEAVLSGESNIGTWNDLVSGQHPLFPEGLSNYYEDMDDPFTIPVNQFEDEGQQGYGYGYGDPGGGTGGGTGGGPGGWLDVKLFSRGRPENIHPHWRDIAGTPMLPVAGSGAGGSLAAADELYSLAAGNKAFSSTPEEQGILALLNA